MIVFAMGEGVGHYDIQAGDGCTVLLRFFCGGLTKLSGGTGDHDMFIGEYFMFPSAEFLQLALKLSLAG